MGEVLFEGNELTKDLLGATQGSGSRFLIAHWANGKVGEIVDLLGDNEYRFIEYDFEPAVNGKPHDIHKIYLTPEEILGRPIVIKGVIGYWLHKQSSSNFRFDKFFEDYYYKCKKEYISKRGKIPDSWKFDMEQEFATSVHLREEVEKIEHSKAIIPFLRDEDNAMIRQVSENYIEFIKQKSRAYNAEKGFYVTTLVELSFFKDKLYSTIVMQNELCKLLIEASENFDKESGHDWFCIYAAYRYSQKEFGKKCEYVNFFTDIELLLPDALTKINREEKGDKRYHKYTMQLRKEVSYWYVNEGSLPPLNELVFSKYNFGCTEDQFRNSTKIIKKLSQQLMQLKDNKK